MEQKLRFGLHQRSHPLTFAVDRTNLFVGRVELHNEEDWNNPNGGLLTLSAGQQVAGECGLLSMAQGGTTPPICVGVERRFDDATNLGIYTYTFEGIATSHAQKYSDSELEFTMTQEPIETHPQFTEINDVYGPYDALNRLWPHFITKESRDAGLAAAASAGALIVNPMFGVSSYYNPGLVYRLTYSDIDVDPGLFDGIGGIVSTPPYIGRLFDRLQSFLAFPGSRNWLKMAPKVVQRGSCLSISEEYMLSGRLGWNAAVYTSAIETSGGLSK